MMEQITACLWTEGGKSSIKGREEGRKEGRRCRKEGNQQSNIFKMANGDGRWDVGCGMWDVGWDDGMFFKEKLGNFLLIVSIFLIK